MYPLDIGLGFSAIEEALKSRNKGFLDKELGQHRIILNKNIANYYLQMGSLFSQEDKDQLQTYVASIAAFADRSVKPEHLPDEVFSNTKEEIVASVMKTPMKILIADEVEFSDYDTEEINLTDRQSVESGTFDCVLNWFVFPLLKTAQKGEPSEQYFHWFSQLFADEHTIVLVDPYLLADPDINTFINKLLPTIPATAKVEVYCVEKNCENPKEVEKKIFRINQEQRRTITIHWCTSDNAHDRYILLSNCIIENSGGLCFCSKDFLSIGKECRFIATKNKDRSLPRTIRIAEEPFDLSMLNQTLDMLITEVLPSGDAKGIVCGKYKATIPKKKLKKIEDQNLVNHIIKVEIERLNPADNSCVVKPVVAQ